MKAVNLVNRTFKPNPPRPDRVNEEVEHLSYLLETCDTVFRGLYGVQYKTFYEYVQNN